MPEPAEIHVGNGKEGVEEEPIEGIEFGPRAMDSLWLCGACANTQSHRKKGTRNVRGRSRKPQRGSHKSHKHLAAAHRFRSQEGKATKARTKEKRQREQSEALHTRDEARARTTHDGSARLPHACARKRNTKRWPRCWLLCVGKTRREDHV